MRGTEVSRRKLLAGVAGAAGTGALVGSGTGALFTDEDLLSGAQAAGSLDLAVTWADGRASGDGVVAIEIDEPDGQERLSVRLPGERNNPAYGWLRTICPGEPLPSFADDIDVTLSYADCATDQPIAEGTLAEVGNQLRGGIPLDPRCPDPVAVSPGEQACLATGESGGVDLLLDWEWDLEADYDGGRRELIALQFVGEQCRNADGTDSPFPDRAAVPTCETPDEGPDRYGISFVEVFATLGGCEFVGKIELEDDYCRGASGLGDSFLAEGTYDLSKGGDDCTDAGYDVRVTDTETKDGGAETVGVAFELLADDGSVGPDLCAVHVKGGPGPPGGDNEIEYAGPFDGNATGGLLYAPKRKGG